MSSSSSPAGSTDVVFLTSITFATTIGADCWHRTRPQPISLSIYLYLKPSYLTQAGISDNVKHSLHYGHLCRDITKAVKGKEQWGSFDELVEAVVGETALRGFSKASEDRSGGNPDLQAVRVVLELPKLVLLADSLEVDSTITAGSDGSTSASSTDNEASSQPVSRTKAITIRNLSLGLIIGVNPPERESKQRVIVNLVLRPRTTYQPTGIDVDYAQLVNDLAKELELTSFFTLEKFVLHAVRTIFQLSPNSTDAIDNVTVRAQKPSALTFAHSPGIEMTRTREQINGLPSHP